MHVDLIHLLQWYTEVCNLVACDRSRVEIHSCIDHQSKALIQWSYANLQTSVMVENCFKHYTYFGFCVSHFYLPPPLPSPTTTTHLKSMYSLHSKVSLRSQRIKGRLKRVGAVIHVDVECKGRGCGHPVHKFKLNSTSKRTTSYTCNLHTL